MYFVHLYERDFGNKEVISCRKDAGYAWRLIIAYFPRYLPSLEYIKEGVK